ncbi:TVP38/TMEM64 family membrane protein slr0305-like isoform X3 [Tripterygium wilfordii]|uniref:TVP38/TMEM64 family membrane protein slr0305-like isoform X3 n=1 Tax=Tripterygium wilfordii TaxID=458696 RepID=UPI0018F856BD|nr:TVP38/TMEM64 family membrane protein slr0305-like isoform X3 [Tripterygium wilfordii]
MRTLLNSNFIFSLPSSSSSSSPSSSSCYCNSSLYSFRPTTNKRFHFLKPCSSLKQTKKQQRNLQKSSAPQSLKGFLNPKGNDDNDDASVDQAKGDGDGEGRFEGETAFKGYGPAGYALFVAVYAGLEVAASIAFLIARYFARERILKLVEGNKKFLAIDKAIGENGFRVVTLLRLSPLLPFSLGNYLYGLTSVKFVPYVLGSWLGMLPGTWAYVSAGAFGRAIIQEESDVGLPGGNGQLLTVGLGLLATALAAAYVTRLAKEAVKDME